MRFSIIYWNVWLDNQERGPRYATRLLSALDEILASYQPDCLGLNEVLRRRNGHEELPFVLQHVQRAGYPHVYYLPSGNWNDDWEIGDAIASKHPLPAIEAITLGRHLTSEGWSTRGEEAKALCAAVDIGGQRLHVVVAHLMHLRPNSLQVHAQHRENLINYMAVHPNRQLMIAGGDFNEFKWMPVSFASRSRSHFHTRTGGLRQPTWHVKARRNRLIQANPDKVIWPKRGRLRLERFAVLPVYASDHKPVHATFMIGEAS